MEQPGGEGAAVVLDCGVVGEVLVEGVGSSVWGTEAAAVEIGRETGERCGLWVVKVLQQHRVSLAYTPLSKPQHCILLYGAPVHLSVCCSLLLPWGCVGYAIC